MYAISTMLISPSSFFSYSLQSKVKYFVIYLQAVQNTTMHKQEISQRRGRPLKKISEYASLQQEFFTIHDQVFHAAILSYTTRIFSKSPKGTKINPSIGYSIYEKMKSLPARLKRYYSDDKIAIKSAQKFSSNQGIVNFFINSLTFAPSCVVDQFFSLFNFIADCQVQPSAKDCLSYLLETQCKYINFNCQVLDILEVKSPQQKKEIHELIDRQLIKIVEILSYTLFSIKNHEKNNKFWTILENDPELFEIGMHAKGRKKIKPQN